MLANVGHTEQLGLRAPATNREIQGPIRTHLGISQWQRCTGHEFFGASHIAGPLGLEMNGIHRAECPIEDVDRSLVLGREPGTGPKGNSDRRSRP